MVELRVSGFLCYYRPQSKFSQVFVCPQGGSGILCPGGSLSRGISVQGGLCLGACLSPSPYAYMRTVRIVLECILVLDKVKVKRKISHCVPAKFKEIENSFENENMLVSCYFHVRINN